jgi:hypothetical protein
MPWIYVTSDELKKKVTRKKTTTARTQSIGKLGFYLTPDQKEKVKRKDFCVRLIDVDKIIPVGGEATRLSFSKILERLQKGETLPIVEGYARPDGYYVTVSGTYRFTAFYVGKHRKMPVLVKQ